MCGPEMAGSSPREREVGSLWCSAYPRLVGVTSPVSCPHPFVNPFTRHSNLSSFLPSLSRILFIVVPLFAFPSSTFLHFQRTPRDVFTFILRLLEIAMRSSLLSTYESILWQEKSSCICVNFWRIKRNFLRYCWFDWLLKRKDWSGIVCKK